MFMYTFLPPASSDYTTVSMDLTFNAGRTNQTVMIPILGDTMVESTESFTVSLVSADSAVILNPSTTTVTIDEDDSKFFGGEVNMQIFRHSYNDKCCE